MWCKVMVMMQGDDDRTIVFQQAEQVTIFCRQQMEYSEDDSKAAVQLTDAQKLCKVIIELVDTEKSYVKVLQNVLVFFARTRAVFLYSEETEVGGGGWDVDAG